MVFKKDYSQRLQNIQSPLNVNSQSYSTYIHLLRHSGWGYGGVSQNMTHYDREGVGVWSIMMYANDTGGGLKGLDIMVKIRDT